MSELVIIGVSYFLQVKILLFVDHQLLKELPKSAIAHAVVREAHLFDAPIDALEGKSQRSGLLVVDQRIGQRVQIVTEQVVLNHK